MKILNTEYIIILFSMSRASMESHPCGEDSLAPVSVIFFIIYINQWLGFPLSDGSENDRLILFLLVFEGKNYSESCSWFSRSLLILCVRAGGQRTRSGLQRQRGLHWRPGAAHGRCRIPGCLQVPHQTQTLDKSVI